MVKFQASQAAMNMLRLMLMQSAASASGRSVDSAMRLFAAIELDDAARAGVVSEQQRLRRLLGASGGPKWIALERMHVTIAFLGNVEEPLLAPVVHALSTPINFAPFALRFVGLECFPAAGRRG